MLAHVINDVALSQAGEIATRAYRERPLDATPCCSAEVRYPDDDVSFAGLCIGSVPWTASTTLSRRLAAAAGTAEQTLQQGPYCRGGVAVCYPRI